MLQLMLQVILLVILQSMLIISNKVPNNVNKARFVAIKINVASNIVKKLI